MLICPACNRPNPRDSAFCNGCGSALGSNRPKASVPPRATSDFPPAGGGAPSSAGGGDRRQLTIMFCDLVDSTALSRRLDPEILSDVIRRYQAACEVVVETFGGYVAQYLGDGLLIYFGFPRAREGAATRSVQAGLGIVSAIESLSDALDQDLHLRLLVRIGIHTGRVVIEAVGGQWLAVGDTPNIAARVTELAAPGTVVASEATHQLLRGAFSAAALGLQGLKGVSEPLSVYRIGGERSPRERVGASDWLTPLVGRHRELGAMIDAWQSCLDGHGQIVLLNGEPGVGKTRLVRAFAESIGGQPRHWLECCGSAHGSSSAYFPLVDLLQEAMKIERSDSPDVRIQKIEAAIGGLDIAHSDAIQVFGSLLSLVTESQSSRSTSAQRRAKSQEVLWSWVLALARQKPVVLFVEDLHWVDPSTLELLSLAVDRIEHAPVMVVLAHRPGFRPAWCKSPMAKSIVVGRLPPTESFALARAIARNVDLPSAVLNEVVIRADCIPLFVEELVKATIESMTKDGADGSGRRTASRSMVPASLHDSLMGRLDRFDVAKEVAQIASVIGREFSNQLLAAIWPGEEEALREGLDTLVGAELLYRRRSRDYAFKHVLIQEVAYESLLHRRRREVHARIADSLEGKFAEIAEARPELVAHHHSFGGRPERAIPLLKKASENAARRAAHLEAVQHATRAIELLDQLPQSEEKVSAELELQLTLSVPLAATAGFSSAEVARVYERAIELSATIGSTAQNFYIQLGLWHLLSVRGELEKARRVSEHLLAEANLDTHSGANRVLRVEAHRACANTLYYLGDFKGALGHIAMQERLYDPSARVFYATKFGQDPSVTAHAYRAFALWMLGHPGQALSSASTCAALAESLNDPLNRAYAHILVASIHQLRREGDEAQAHAELAATIAEEHGFDFWLGAARCQLGAAVALKGDCTGGIATLSRGIRVFQEKGARLALPYGYSMLAEAHLWASEYERGLEAIDRGLAITGETGERAYEPELYRVRGELLIGRDPKNVDDSEHSLQQACDLAAQMSARSLELRALTALARIQLARQDGAMVRHGLRRLYEAFDEGRSTRDHCEARAVLAM